MRREDEVSVQTQRSECANTGQKQQAVESKQGVHFDSDT